MESGAEIKTKKKGMTAQTRLILAGLGVSTAFILASAGFATYSINQNMNHAYRNFGQVLSKTLAIEGVEVTTFAFQKGLAALLPSTVASFILMICLAFFAFTTILGWDYYSERCLEYLSGGNLKHVKVYRWIYIFAVFIGPYMTVSAVWTIADIFNGLMALPNMIALFALSGVVVKETKAFFKKQN